MREYEGKWEAAESDGRPGFVLVAPEKWTVKRGEEWKIFVPAVVNGPMSFIVSGPPLFQVKHPRENKEHQKKIKGFILENVTQYTPTLIAGQLAPEDEGRFAILDVDQLAEVIQRYYLEKDPSFPVKE